MAKVTQNYVLEVTAKGLKEVVREIKALRNDIAGMSTATSTAAAGMSKVSKSAGELDRNSKGAANATNNSTKAFSKMAQGMQGTLVPAYATVAANVFALTAAFGALERAADTQILIKASEELAAQTGRSLSSVAKSMKEITGGAISMKEGLTQASLAASAGFDNSTIEQLAQVARNASVALGRDLTDSMNRVFKGAIKAEPELLDELGIILRLDPATRAYAASVGKAVGDLSTFEKQQAIVNAVLEQGQEKFGKLSEVDVNPYTQLSSTFTDMTASAIGFVNVGLEPIVKLLAENMGLLTGAFILFATTVAKTAFPILQEMGILVTENLVQGFNALTDSLSADLVAKSYFEPLADELTDLDQAFEHTKLAFDLAFEDLGEDLPDNLSEQILGNLDDDALEVSDRVGTSIKAVDEALSELETTGDKTTASYGRQKAALINTKGALLTYSLAVKQLSIEQSLLTKIIDGTSGALARASGAFKLFKLSGAKGFQSGINDGFLSLLQNIKNYSKGIDEANVRGTLFGKVSKIMSTGIFGISGALGSFVKFIPIIGYLTIAWQILSKAVTWVFDLFRDNDIIEDTNKALKDQTAALKTAEKAVKRYNDELANAPKTFENVNKQLEMQTNILTELDAANQELIANSGGFSEFMGSDLEEYTDNLNRQLEVLKGFGAVEEVNKILEEFGKNGELVEDSALAAGSAVSKLSSEMLGLAADTSDANNKLEDTFKLFTKSTQALINDAPKLNSVQNAYVGITKALTELDDALGSDMLTQASALNDLLEGADLNITGIREQVDDINAVIKSTKDLTSEYVIQKSRIKEINEELEDPSRNSRRNNALRKELAILTASVAVSDDVFKRAEDRLADLAEIAKKKLAIYRDTLRDIVYATDNLARSTRAIDFKIALPGTSPGEQLSLETEKVDKQLKSMLVVQQLTRAAIIATSDSLSSAQRKALNQYEKEKEAQSEKLKFLETNEEFMKLVHEAKQIEKQDVLENIQLILLQQETDQKAYDLKIKLLDKYHKAYKDSLSAVQVGDSTFGSSSEEILTNALPLLQQVINLQEQGKMTAKEYADYVAKQWESWGKFNTVIQEANNISLKGLEDQKAATVDKIAALRDEKELNKSELTNIQDRIDKSQLLANSVLERLKTTIEIAKVEEESSGNDSNIIAKYDDLIAKISEVQNANDNLGLALIDSQVAQQNIQAKLVTDRIQNELNGNLRISEVEKSRLNFMYEMAKLQSQIGKHTSDEIDARIELLNLAKKQAIQIGLKVDMKEATDSISKFSDIMQEFSDRMNDIDLSTVEKQMAGIVALNKIAAESGDKTTQSLTGLIVAVQDYTNTISKTGSDKLGASLTLASQAMMTMAGSMEEGSSAAKLFTFAAQSLAIIQATTAILNQAQGEPYSAWIRMAAMAASVTALLGAAGVAFSGTSGSSGRAEYEASFGDDRITGQEYQTNAWVDSIDNLSTINEALFGAEKELRRALYDLKKSVDNSAKALYSQGGTFSAGDIASKFGKTFGTTTTGNQFLWASGSKSSELVAAGLELGASIQIVGDTISTSLKDARLFITEEVTKTKTGLLGRTKTSTDLETSFQNLTADVKSGLSEALDASIVSILQLMDNFGSDVESVFSNYTLSIPTQQLNLTGLSAAEQGEVVAAYLSGIGNTILKDTIPWLDEYRNAGEELLDTLIRLVDSTQALNEAFSAGGTSIDQLAAIGEYTRTEFKLDNTADKQAVRAAINDLLDLDYYFGGLTGSDSDPGRDEIAKFVASVDDRFKNTTKALAYLDEITMEAGHGILSQNSINADELKAIEDVISSELSAADRKLTALKVKTYQEWSEDQIAQDREAWKAALEKAYGGPLEDFASDYDRFLKAVFSTEELSAIQKENAEAVVNQGIPELAYKLNKIPGQEENLDYWNSLIASLDDSADSAKILGILYKDMADSGAFAGVKGAKLLETTVALGVAYSDLIEATEEVETAVDNFLRDILRRINEFGKSGKELDLLNLQYEFEDLLAEAATKGAKEVAAVEFLYGLERVDIVKKYNEEIVNALKDALFQVNDGLLSVINSSSAWNDTAYESVKIDKIRTRLIKSFSVGDFDGIVGPALEAFRILSTIDTSGTEEFVDALGEYLLFSEEVPENIEEQIDLTLELQEAIVARYQNELQYVEELKSLSSDINNYLSDLAIGDLSPLTNKQRFDELNDRFAKDLEDINSGNAEVASAAASRLLEDADALLQLGSELYAIGPQYQELFSYVVQALQSVDQELNDKIVSEKDILSELQLTTIDQLAAVTDILDLLKERQNEIFQNDLKDILGNDIVNPLKAIEDVLSRELPNIVTALNDLQPYTSGILPSIPQLDVGSVNVPFDQLAVVHQGEMVVPPNISEGIRTGTTTLGVGIGASVDTASIVAAINTLTQVLAESQGDLLDQGERQINTTENIVKSQTANTNVRRVGIL